jgi:hypothetical protein
MQVESDTGTGQCSLCERRVPREMITLHHLRPREKGGKAEHRTSLCRPCHKQLHAVFSNKALAQSYDSLDRLRAEPSSSRSSIIRRQKAGRNFRTAMSNNHPARRGRR